MSEDLHRWLSAVTRLCRAATLEVCSPDSCIASTRVLIGVLDYFGYASEPLPCTAVVWNAAGYEATDAEIPVDQWPPDAHSVGVVGTGAARAPKRWDGHLVAMVEDRWLIDASLDQFSRPQKGIVTTPLVIDAVDWDDRTKMHVWRRGDGIVIGYQLMPNPGAWRSSPDWRGERHQRIIGGVIRQIRRSSNVSA